MIKGKGYTIDEETKVISLTENSQIKSVMDLHQQMIVDGHRELADDFMRAQDKLKIYDTERHRSANISKK